MSRSPWEAVKVVAREPASSAPWTADAAPASDCIWEMTMACPYMFFRPCPAHSSTSSAMGEEGVMG